MEKRATHTVEKERRYVRNPSGRVYDPEGTLPGQARPGQAETVAVIYLDYNATTPVDPRVVDAMLPYLRDHHGNPSSTHALGQRMRTGVEAARRQVAHLLGASPDEIVFTSGGSESNNHVLKGLAYQFRERPYHVIISAIEHPAITAPCRYLASLGARITAVPVDSTGLVDPDDVRRALTPATVLVSIMHANNEVGTIEPIAEITDIAREADVLMHTDAAQSVGKIPVNVGELGVDFLSVAGHKLYAPHGIGALHIRQGRTLESLIHGAGHESGRRAGTEAVATIVALGCAAELAGSAIADPTIQALRDRLHNGLRTALGDDVVLNGHPELRLPNTLNVSFRGKIGADVLASLDGIAASPGAACHSAGHEPSAVLTAMGLPREIALGAIRFSVGRFTTEQDVDEAVAQIVRAARK
jgi:cysteine desulfurase